MAHRAKMMMEPGYAEDFIRNSMPKGKVFTLTFESVDPLKTRELFEAVASNTATPDKPKLIAGAKVLTIYTGDETARLRGKFQRIANEINSPL